MNKKSFLGFSTIALTFTFVMIGTIYAYILFAPKQMNELEKETIFNAIPNNGFEKTLAWNYSGNIITCKIMVSDFPKENSFFRIVKVYHYDALDFPFAKGSTNFILEFGRGKNVDTKILRSNYARAMAEIVEKL